MTPPDAAPFPFTAAPSILIRRQKKFARSLFCNTCEECYYSYFGEHFSVPKLVYIHQRIFFMCIYCTEEF